MKWTAQQYDAITEKSGNILVSAAAGSGKTAVLVERIIQMITDEESPVDIDRFLVVTFTKAAASEMKERISSAVAEKIRENPNNRNLKRQAVLINRADITTIHSFCLKVVRENYNKLGIDPAFRVADEAETLLLKDEVIEDLFEKKYSSENPDEFLYLVETYTDGTNDRRLKELILKIYDFIRSYPNPDEWIREQKNRYESDNDNWFDIMKEQMCRHLEGALELEYEAMKIINESGPDTYAPMLVNDIIRIEDALSKRNESFEQFSFGIKNIEFDALSRKKCESLTKEKVKSIRDRVKKLVAEINSKFLMRPYENMKTDIGRAGRGISILLDMVSEFSVLFDEAKRKRRIVDYGDLEHYCLQVLMGENCSLDNPVKSPEAKVLSEKYAYVMTDEYQDSNAVQEMVLSLVSRENNRFMVGDVKQSIYSFRLANPDIFTEKYNSYSLEKGAENERIDMFMNFRSRKEILDGINFIFMQFMQKSFGGIDYDDRAKLYAGADFPDNDEGKIGGAIEVDVIVKESSDNDDSNETVPAEIEFVAQRIKKLVDEENFKVYDAKKSEYRDIKYSDIAIITRNKTHTAEYMEALSRYQIPHIAEVDIKFFNSTENMIAVNFLRLIDNPRQDIALASVLRSEVYGLNADDLLTIKLESQGNEYWDCVLNYEENGTNERIKETLRLFISQLDNWRNIASETNITELIWSVYTDTGYFDLVGVLPEGKKRQENLKKLVRKAADYDKVSYKGLFDFIRYVEKIDNQNLEKEEAGHGSNGVQIMTIHKSKGLEFPVVILAGCGTKLNRTDLTENLIIHKNFGIGSEYIDEATRIKYNTVPRVVASEELKSDQTSEEIRVLYVAMTRAKQKLIITGAASLGSTKLNRWTMFTRREEKTIPVIEALSAANYLDWIMMAVSRHPDGKVIRKCIDEGMTPKLMPEKDDDSRFEINFIRDVKLGKAESIDDIKELISEEDRAFLKSQISARLNWEYPYGIQTGIPGSVSVSDIKRLRGKKLLHTVRTPDFYSEDKGLTAAEKGTAVHKVIEHMDFSKAYNYEDIKNLINGLKTIDVLTEEEAKVISIKKINMFAESEIYQRILKAEKVYKEEAFTVAVAPSEVYGSEDYDIVDDKMILHGRIDCYFIENGEIVLLDYKTDRFDEESDEIFHQRYDIQMKLYSAALEEVTGIKVKECYIYSVDKGQLIEIKK